MAGRCIYREQNADSHLEIWEDGDRRSLWFDDVILQSEIHIHDAAVLPNPINRAMLAHLMLELPFRSVMLAGCGGGAIARWLHARAPKVRGDAVELSATVARLAFEYFDFPPAHSNWRLLIEDVREHLVHVGPGYDFILVDLEENQSTPDWVTGTEFLSDCRRHLNKDGVLTLNLIDHEGRAVSEALQRIRRVFETELMLSTDPQHDNLLVHAFNSTVPQLPPRQVLEDRGRRWGIDFTALANRITRVPGPSSSAAR